MLAILIAHFPAPIPVASTSCSRYSSVNRALALQNHLSAFSSVCPRHILSTPRLSYLKLGAGASIRVFTPYLSRAQVIVCAVARAVFGLSFEFSWSSGAFYNLYDLLCRDTVCKAPDNALVGLCIDFLLSGLQQRLCTRNLAPLHVSSSLPRMIVSCLVFPQQ